MRRKIAKKLLYQKARVDNKVMRLVGETDSLMLGILISLEMMEESIRRRGGRRKRLQQQLLLLFLRFLQLLPVFFHIHLYPGWLPPHHPSSVTFSTTEPAAEQNLGTGEEEASAL
ncbi:unnamed protein product [Victoria cruziana]